MFLFYEKIFKFESTLSLQDVIPYIDSSQLKFLDIWSNDYFLQLADMMKIQS